MAGLFPAVLWIMVKPLNRLPSEKLGKKQVWMWPFHINWAPIPILRGTPDIIQFQWRSLQKPPGAPKQPMMRRKWASFTADALPKPLVFDHAEILRDYFTKCGEKG
jgi:hypothetical protein